FFKSSSQVQDRDHRMSRAVRLSRDKRHWIIRGAQPRSSSVQSASGWRLVHLASVFERSRRDGRTRRHRGSLRVDRIGGSRRGESNKQKKGSAEVSGGAMGDSPVSGSG